MWRNWNVTWNLRPEVNWKERKQICIICCINNVLHILLWRTHRGIIQIHYAVWNAVTQLLSVVALALLFLLSPLCLPSSLSHVSPSARLCGRGLLPPHCWHLPSLHICLSSTHRHIDSDSPYTNLQRVISAAVVSPSGLLRVIPRFAALTSFLVLLGSPPLPLPFCHTFLLTKLPNASSARNAPQPHVRLSSAQLCNPPSTLCLLPCLPSSFLPSKPLLN